MQTPYGLVIEGMEPYVSAHYSGGDTHQINVPKSRLVGDGKFSSGVKVQPPWDPGGGLGTSRNSRSRECYGLVHVGSRLDCDMGRGG